VFRNPFAALATVNQTGLMEKSPSIRVEVNGTSGRLSELLRAVAAGHSVEILRNGEPIARLEAIGSPTKRTFGVDEGRFVVPDDFDQPMGAW
jgi:antitoxin (DNA-binding transcriptional repressor) of toxin-antitoxin stability system